MQADVFQKEKLVQYLEALVTIPSPTGFTQEIVNFLEMHAQQKGIAYQKTQKGAIMYQFAGANSQEPGIVLAAHVDALGAMVKQVNKDSVELTSIGGYPALYIVGDYCTIHSFEGKTFSGTILPKNPAAHVHKGLSDLKPNFDNVNVRLDWTPENDDDKLENHLQVGNFVSFDPKFQYINGFVKSRHLDDKASAAVLLYLADLLLESASQLKRNVTLFFNVTEETGQGLAGFQAIRDLLIIDMGVVGDGVQGDEQCVSICVKDSSGPYHYEFTQSLYHIAKTQKIDAKLDVFPYYGSDGSAALHAGHDIRVALIGPGVSASHGYERTHEKGLIHTTNLAWNYLKQEYLAD